MAFKAEIKGKKLHIEIDLESDPHPSSTGKTVIVASTRGNQATSVQIDGKPVFVGVTAFVKPNK